jgi:hypothetical protein
MRVICGAGVVEKDRLHCGEEDAVGLCAGRSADDGNREDEGAGSR